MQVQVFMTSARDLKNVNWRNGSLKPYAVVSIDSSVKFSTKADLDNNVNPVWNEKFSIPLPLTSHPETAILHIDVVHAIASPNTKPLVGSVKLPLSSVLMEARANGKVARRLDLNRPSGRPQGIINIKIGVKDQNISLKDQYGQHAFNNMPMSPEVKPQSHVQYQPQAQFHPQPQTIYGSIYPPVGLSATRQNYNPALNMAFAAEQTQQIMKQMAEQYNHNYIEALSNAGAYIDGQSSDEGLEGFDNGSEPDLSGYMGNGSGIGLSNSSNGFGSDLSGINGVGRANFSGSMYGGGAFARRMYDANQSLNTLGKIG